MRNLQPDRNTLAGMGAILIWSTSIALARSITEQLGPLTGAAAIHLVGGVFCWSQFFYRSRGTVLSFRQLPRKFLLGCGALFVLYMLALYLAVGLAGNRSQVLEIGLVNYLWPALTIFFSLFLLNKKAKLALWPGSFLALLGVFLVLTQGHSISFSSLFANVSANPPAYTLALTAAVSWGLYSNLTRRWAGPRMEGGVELFVSVTGVVFLILRMLHPEGGSWTLRAGLEVTFLGMATALGYLLWDMAMRKGDVVFVAACSYFTPLFSTLLSCLYLHVTAGVSLWLGCLLIVAGSLLSWLAVSDRKTQPLPLSQKEFESRQNPG